MTLADAVEYVRNRHNAAADSNWNDSEIYALITARCNEILSVLGLIEATDTSLTSVTGQQAYNFPTNVHFIKKITYDGYPVSLISLNEWEQEKTGGTDPSGRPVYWFEWNRQILFTPIPDETGKQITLYCEKEHPLINNTTQTTIDIPSILHTRMLDGVLVDMYAKDLNQSWANFYETKWNQVHMPAFYRYKMNLKYRGKNPPLLDADTATGNDLGVV